MVDGFNDDNERSQKKRRTTTIGLGIIGSNKQVGLQTQTSSPMSKAEGVRGFREKLTNFRNALCSTILAGPGRSNVGLIMIALRIFRRCVLLCFLSVPSRGPYWTVDALAWLSTSD